MTAFDLDLILFEETTVSETDAGTDETGSADHGVDLQFDSLSDLPYTNDNLVEGYDVELFSEEAFDCEVDHRIRTDVSNIAARDEYFRIEETEPLSVADEITRELQGGLLFDDSQAKLNYTSAPHDKINGTVLIIILAVSGILIGTVSAMVWRKIRRRLNAGA